MHLVQNPAYSRASMIGALGRRVALVLVLRISKTSPLVAELAAGVRYMYFVVLEPRSKIGCLYDAPPFQ